ALMLRGLVQEANEKPEEAVKDYNAVLRLQPTHKLAKASLDRLKAPVSAPPITPPRDPSDLEEKERITLLQRELKRVGCDPGEIDGEWGENTRSALSLFANYTGLSLDIDAPSNAAFAAVSEYKDRACPGSSSPQGITDGRWTGNW